MNNIIEIIIKAVTKDAEKNIKKTESALTRFGKAARNVGRDLKTLAATAGIASGILFLMAKGIESIAERAEALGDTRLTRSIEKLKNEFQQLADQILTTNLGNGTILDALNQGAKNLIPVVRAIGVVVEMAIGGFRDMIITIQRLSGIIDEAQGKTTQYTKAWVAQAIAQNHATTNARIGLIWEGKLTDEIIRQNNALGYNIKANRALGNMNKRVGESLDSLIAKQKSLNSEMNKSRQIEDAIRRGDARALADLQSSSSGRDFANLVPGSGPRANGGAAPTGRSMNGGTNVQIFLNDKPINGMIDDIIVNGIRNAKPASAASGRKK